VVRDANGQQLASPKNEANSENSLLFLSESLTPKNEVRGAPDSAIRSYF
jgi:hypothetical protein